MVPIWTTSLVLALVVLVVVEGRPVGSICLLDAAQEPRLPLAAEVGAGDVQLNRVIGM
jgi:hypothetical protein